MNIRRCRRIASPEPPVTRFPLNPGDVFLENGFSLEPVAAGLTYPTSMAFDDHGNLYVAESGYSYGPAKAEGLGRILLLDRDGAMTEVASGFRPPLTGVTYFDGALYVAEGAFPGRITRLCPNGSRETLVDGLRSGGDHFTGDIAFGPNGKMYFGVGTFTNSAVVGVDNFLFGWLPDMPAQHDLPARPYVLRGVNYTSANPFTLDQPVPGLAVTGAFKPFGVPSCPGEVIPGTLFANGVVYEANPDGSRLRIVADGFRNPFGLRFSPEGKLYATDQGYDGRGSRPIEGAPDVMWEIHEGGWYGWPDYAAGIPVACWHRGPGIPPEPVLACHPPLAGPPVLLLEGHSASTKFDFSTNPRFGHVGEAFIAQLGSGAPVTGMPRGAPGYRVVRADLRTGQVHDFLVSLKPVYGGTGPQRPVDVKFNPDGDALYVLDFGALSGNLAGAIPYAQSGMLWRVTPAR